MSHRAGGLVAASPYRALLVIASSGRDADLAPFIGPARLGQSMLVVASGAEPRLAILSPLDRGEAETTGLEVLGPDALDVARQARESSSPVEMLTEVVRRALQLAGVGSGRIALAGHGQSGTVLEVFRRLEVESGWTFESGHTLLAELRRGKDPDELTEIRRAAEGAGAALRRVASLLAAADVNSDGDGDGDLALGAEPLTIGRLRREIAIVLAEHHLEQPEGNIVAPAEEGSVPHNTGTNERVVRGGESLVVDLFPKGRLYADCTRTFCVGEPPAELAAAWKAVHRTLAEAHQSAAAGADCWQLQQAACDTLSSLGYPTPITDPGTERGYVHGLGHGIGYELHEAPSFREQTGGRLGRLAVGDVFTLEPGLYDGEARFAVRLEDLCHLGEEGLENLTPLPYDLDPRAWE